MLALYHRVGDEGQVVADEHSRTEANADPYLSARARMREADPLARCFALRPPSFHINQPKFYFVCLIESRPTNYFFALISTFSRRLHVSFDTNGTLPS